MVESTAAIPSPDQPVPDDFEPLCEQCGYSLTGLTTQTRCPECGEAFDLYSLPLARVPWLYRKRLGNNSAYWKTVWLILRHPRAFADELCRPVRISADDAKKFRRKSARLAVYSIGFAVLILLLLMATITRLSPIHWVGIAIGFGIAALILYAFFIFATDLPTFIWSGLAADPNNLAPLHHYAAAPLATSPLVGLGLLGILAAPFLRVRVPFSPNLRWGYLAAAVLVGGILILLPSLFMLWRWPQILMKQATGCSKGRVAALALYLPIHWVLIGILALVAQAISVGTIVSLLRH